MSPAGQGGPPSHHAAPCDLTKTAAFLCGGSLGTLDNFLSIFLRITHQGKKGKNYIWNLGYCCSFRKEHWLPRWLSGKESACDAGDLGSIPGSGKSPGEGNGNLLQHSCLGNPMDRGAWWAAVHGVAQSRTRLSYFHFSLSCTGEGIGNPLQYSCLVNPRDGILVGCRLWGRTESDTADVT